MKTNILIAAVITTSILFGFSQLFKELGTVQTNVRIIASMK